MNIPFLTSAQAKFNSGSFPKLKLRQIIGLVLAVVVLIGGGWWLWQQEDSSSHSDRLQVTATYYPLYDFAQRVGGQWVTVTNITPAGQEPHEYEPTPQQLAGMQKSQILLYNGATFEPWIQDFLPSYSHSAVAANHNIAMLTGESQGTTDPHYWLDPVLAQTMIITIRDAFSKADPDHSTEYARQASEYIIELQKLDGEFSQGLANCRLHEVISSHEALRYLAGRYNFQVEAITGISPEDDPSPATLANLATLIKQKGITTVFFEELVSPRLAQTLASETGATTAVFDPIEGMSDDDIAAGANYLSVQRQNLSALRSAMQCQ